jgi:hypothetical protein
MTERVFARASLIVKGKFIDHPGTVVGKVLPDGRIENTPYKFKSEIRGGVAVTTNSTLIIDGDDLVNPATGERFKPTKRATGFFSWLTQCFIKPYAKYDDESGN